MCDENLDEKKLIITIYPTEEYKKILKLNGHIITMDPSKVNYINPFEINSFNPLESSIDECLRTEFKDLTLYDLSIITKNISLIEKQILLKNKAHNYINKGQFAKSYKILSKAKKINKKLGEKSKYANNLDEIKLFKLLVILKKLLYHYQSI